MQKAGVPGIAIESHHMDEILAGEEIIDSKTGVVIVQLSAFPSQCCLLFADDRKIGGINMQWEGLQSDLFTVDAWAERNDMFLNASKKPAYTYWWIATTSLLISDDNETPCISHWLARLMT